VGWLPWKDALAIAIPLLVVGFAWRPRGRAPRTLAALLREGGVVVGLYAFWTWMGAQSLRHVDGAFAHGASVWHLERALHLPSEVSVQRPFLGHPDLVHLLDQYYAWVHVPAIGAFLLWLFLRHRARYPEWRTSLAILTGLCFVIQLVPVAPPRMFPGYGFVDTGVAFGDSVYGRLGEAGPAQLSAMPSVHVAWAAVVGWGVVAAGTSRWRWLALGHTALTVLVVVATANHWWMDGIVAIAMLAVIRPAVAWAYRREWPRLLPAPRPARMPARVAEDVADPSGGPPG
jgi:hypothetical protein